ncbi:hypothetical protein BKA64DRAFT_184604 [Cadophora sp. MPI-SDFR-AT-0126]|nr:hypothetical protein BKA64DRAFT_184604 [Leotiomycetes sp. MPI-SDFR-AT-0126]
MCKFLVHKKADVNAIEPDLYGYIGPLHSGQWVLPAEATEIELHKGAQCIRIMLEAGADFSLEADHGNGEWLNGFMDAVECRSLAQFQHIVNLGEPFIDLRVNYKIPSGECSALTILADTCGYAARETIDVADKAILLLNRKADISCRNGIGDTVLHTVLRCMRLHERISRTKARRSGIVERWKLSFTAPKDLLMVFVTAGADVCATNDYGETPSMVALEYGREDEWIEALELCGYDPEVVLNSCIHYPMGEDQRSKLSFQEYCQQRQQRKHHGPFEQVDVESIENDSDNDDEQVCGEVQSEDDDDSHYDDKNAYEEDIHEETRAIADDPERIDGGSGNIGILGGYGMDIGVDNEGREHTYHAEEIFYHPVLRFDEI